MSPIRCISGTSAGAFAVLLLPLLGSAPVWAQGVVGNPCAGLAANAAASPAQCQWQNFTRDPRAFAAQPGGVCPIGSFKPGRYRILVGPTGPEGRNMPPAWWNSYGPYSFGKGDKWIAVMGWQSRLDRFEKNVGELLPYADPGSRSGVYARNNDSSQWQAICIVAAGGAGADTGGEEPRCRHYAETAVQQQRQNLARRCGYRGDPWHVDAADHRRWCLSVPAERSDAENAMRQHLLANCGGDSQPARCDHYARTAQWQQQQNLDRGCDYRGDAWHSDAEDHRRWCLSVPAERSDAESAMRDRQLADCERRGGDSSTGCGDYARTAVAQQQENVSRGCGFAGAPWHSDYGEHFRWCQSVPVERSQAETAMRRGKLSECR